jgi:hypothetical protein
MAEAKDETLNIQLMDNRDDARTVGKSRGKRYAFTRFAHRFNPLRPS